jgi:ElaB/YqjD/DUF883 family membrane-anchored ribosome-binding protein
MTNDSFQGGPEPRTNGAEKAIVDDGKAIQDAARKLGDQAADAGERAWRQAVEAGKHVTRHVEEQPWGAVIVTGLLGLVIGMLLGRSSIPAAPTARDRIDEYLPRRLRQR